MIKRKKNIDKIKYECKYKKLGEYKTDGGNLKEIEQYKIHLNSDICEDICNIYIYDILTTDTEGKKFIEYPNNEIKIEYENTLNDDYSVFITKSYVSTSEEKNLLEIYINVYKKDNFASNKRLFALGAIKIDSEGRIKYDNN